MKWQSPVHFHLLLTLRRPSRVYILINTERYSPATVKYVSSRLLSAPSESQPSVRELLRFLPPPEYVNSVGAGNTRITEPHSIRYTTPKCLSRSSIRLSLYWAALFAVVVNIITFVISSQLPNAEG